MILNICDLPEVMKVMRIINIVILIIRIVVPILLMISAMISLVHAITDAELNKLTKPMVNKVIAAVLVFLIPTFVRVIARIAGNNGAYEKCLTIVSKQEIQDAYTDQALSWTEKAEDTKTIDDYNTAQTYLIHIKDQDEKTALQERLDKVKEEIEKEREKGGSSGGGGGGSASSLPSITDDSKFDSYTKVATCDSSTFKYKILSYNNDDYVLIWLSNPYMQINGALASNGSTAGSADSILSKEISSNGYSNKCLIATNASFFNMSSGSSNANIILNKGNVLRNDGNATSIGITNQNELKEYINQPLSAYQADGVRNNFVHSNRIIIKNTGSKDTTNRIIICQVNTNNFILISGTGQPSDLAYTANQMTTVQSCFNLDGGGSRKLYYQTQSQGITKRFGGGRKIPDMLYFVE